MDKTVKTCCICGKKFIGWGNNPWPVNQKGECRAECNWNTVIPTRLKQLKNK